MSGKIIEFRGHHDLRRARLHAKQTVPRWPARQTRLDLEENGEGDPQPDVDRELLERMYRHLDLHT